MAVREMEFGEGAIRCGMCITPEKRAKIGYMEFIVIAKEQGVLVEDLDLEGDHASLPSNLDAILHKVSHATEQDLQMQCYRNFYVL